MKGVPFVNGRYTKEAPLLFIQYLTNKVRNSHLPLTFKLLSEVNEQRLFMWTDLRSLMSSVSMQNNLDQLVILCSSKKRLILVVSYSPPISFFYSPVSFQYVLRTWSALTYFHFRKFLLPGGAKRNWKQCLCKNLEGHQRVLWYFYCVIKWATYSPTHWL